MQSTDSPARIPLAFAASGTKNVIPTASQIGITPGAASLNDGFPPLTFTPIAAGGVPPSGADFNGVLNMITGVQRWQSAGGGFKFDAAFAASVGGYPKGATLVNAASDGAWLCLLDANSTNPDATDGSAANWAPVDTYGAATVALSGAGVTLTPAQYGKPIIILTGTLTANVQVTMPKIVGQWTVINATTGAFATSLTTAGGTPIAIIAGGVTVRGDGANVINDSAAASSMGANGYQKFPSGLIAQWGSASVVSTQTVTLPIPFPTACIGVIGVGQTSIDSDVGGSAWVESGIVSRSQIFLKTVRASASGNIAASRGVGYLAWGY